MNEAFAMLALICLNNPSLGMQSYEMVSCLKRDFYGVPLVLK